MARKSAPVPESRRSAAPRPQQLELVVEHSDAPWRIDDETREIGRRGLAKARAVLDASRAPFADLAA